jgi:hypothetical protein
LNHAVIYAEFAIEEFGKILMLRDEYGKGSDPVQVPDKVFTSHRGKPERAWKRGDSCALDSKYKMISKGGFQRSPDRKCGFSRGFSQVIDISHYIRLECAFVDYSVEEKLWFVGHLKIVKDRLQELLNHIRIKTTNLAL